MSNEGCPPEDVCPQGATMRRVKKSKSTSFTEEKEKKAHNNLVTRCMDKKGTHTCHAL